MTGVRGVLKLDVLYERPHTVSEFHTEVPQATAREGLAQGPYVVARAGFKSTNESPHPTTKYQDTLYSI